MSFPKQIIISLLCAICCGSAVAAPAEQSDSLASPPYSAPADHSAPADYLRAADYSAPADYLLQSAALAADLGIVQVLKSSVHSLRPDLSDSHSFPSRHAAVAWNVSTALSRLLVARNELWAPALQLAASAVSQQRVMARRHHVGDVFAGAAIGVGTNLLAFAIADAFTHKHRGYPASALVPRRGASIAVSSSCLFAWDVETPLAAAPGESARRDMWGYGTGIDLCLPLHRNLYFDVEGALASYLLRIDCAPQYRYIAHNAGSLAVGVALRQPWGKHRLATLDLAALLGGCLRDRALGNSRFATYAKLRIGAHWQLLPRLSLGCDLHLAATALRPSAGLSLSSRYAL